MKKNPARYCIDTLGGIRATSRIVGRDPASVFRWLKPRRKKTKGGQIPPKMMRVIYDYARKNKIDITLVDLVYGR